MTMKQNAAIGINPDAAISITSLSSPMALQGFLEAAPDAIVVVDTDGQIVVVNQLTESMFGYTRGELLGKTIELLVPERYRPSHAKDRAAYFRAPRTRSMGGMRTS